MALITLVGDSDGDLHTADLHNKKFGAIASVLNGNVDLVNLTNPKSRSLITISCDGYSVNTPNANAEFYQMTGGGTGNISGTGWYNAASGFSLLKSSIMKIPFGATVVSANVVFAEIPSVWTSGQNFTISIQKGSSLTGSYSNVGSFSTDFDGSAKLVEIAISFSPTSISANEYIIVVSQNPSTFTSGRPPGGFVITIELKTDHIP